MSWCIDCGTEGRPIAATTTVEGDPLCAAHAKARGDDKPVFNDEFVNRRMADFTKQPAEPSAPKEKVMSEEAKCGCGRPQAHHGRCAFRRKQGHSALRFNKTTKAIEKFDPHPSAPLVAERINVYDSLWNALPAAQKKAALHALIDAIL